MTIWIDWDAYRVNVKRHGRLWVWSYMAANFPLVVVLKSLRFVGLCIEGIGELSIEGIGELIECAGIWIQNKTTRLFKRLF